MCKFRRKQLWHFVAKRLIKPFIIGYYEGKDFSRNSYWRTPMPLGKMRFHNAAFFNYTVKTELFILEKKTTFLRTRAVRFLTSSLSYERPLYDLFPLCFNCTYHLPVYSPSALQNHLGKLKVARCWIKKLDLWHGVSTLGHSD